MIFWWTISRRYYANLIMCHIHKYSNEQFSLILYFLFSVFIQYILQFCTFDIIFLVRIRFCSVHIFYYHDEHVKKLVNKFISLKWLSRVFHGSTYILTVIKISCYSAHITTCLPLSLIIEWKHLFHSANLLMNSRLIYTYLYNNRTLSSTDNSPLFPGPLTSFIYTLSYKYLIKFFLYHSRSSNVHEWQS